ncbi:hypothetical protein ALC62_01374 [Cyphomyrmex costatus]|uniref:Uncharacterized protein n=1 Tax=Cyphomyrmex costatus TaxID=456900 RepID=A0A151IP94_9HYME|nr:hypothetical protein ALC62_01374 [Cyphomyrmex costatus]
MVEPPDNTILLYNGLLTSIGQQLTSGWKNISGPRNLSYPTSTTKGCLVMLLIPSYFLIFVGSLSYLANSFDISGHM